MEQLPEELKKELREKYNIDLDRAVASLNLATQTIDGLNKVLVFQSVALVGLRRMFWGMAAVAVVLFLFLMNCHITS
jgi:hypothetical protein